jgi:hypothetical protein
MKGEQQQHNVTEAKGKEYRPAPFGALLFLLLLALASIGVVYGLWSKVLVIEGTVQTGRLHARWDGAICSEFFNWPWPPEGNGEVDGKDVGSTTITIDPNDNNRLLVTINNGYPSYAVDCEVEYVNDGTIPFLIRGTTIVPGPGLTNCTLTGNQTKTLACDQLTVILVDGIGSQIDPGDGVASSLRVHVEQKAGQNAEYTFDVKICVAQWNEAATAAQCFAAAPTPTPGP